MADVLVEELGHPAIGNQGAPGIVEAAVGFQKGAEVAAFLGGGGILDRRGHAGQVGGWRLRRRRMPAAAGSSRKRNW
jgi:hypothetical protein